MNAQQEENSQDSIIRRFEQAVYTGNETEAVASFITLLQFDSRYFLTIPNKFQLNENTHVQTQETAMVSEPMQTLLNNELNRNYYQIYQQKLEEQRRVEENKRKMLKQEEEMKRLAKEEQEAVK